MSDITGGLAALERQVARELDILAYPTPNWVRPVTAPDGSIALDCAVVGAGMFGLAVGGLLKRERVTNVMLFDQAEAGREGPWVTFARMTMLRTPKHLSGPELGLPSLSFRPWYEAQHGAEGWAQLPRTPRTGWMEYLNWFRRVMDLPVTNGWRLTGLEPVGDGALIRLTFETEDGPQSRYARSVLLSTGALGAGGYKVPDAIAQAVPGERLVHAMAEFDMDMMRGQRLGILGAGPSGFDLAIAAIQAGATSAEVCVRRAALPRDNHRRWIETAGFLAHYPDMPDARKWDYAFALHDRGQPPPQHTFDAAMALPDFRLRQGFPWESVRWTGSEIIVEGQGNRAAYDRIAIATGFVTDLTLRPELQQVLSDAALWSDRYTPPPGQEIPGLARAPYLDRYGGYQERVPGAAPWLSRLFTIISTANLSLGPVAASVSTMKYMAPRLVEGVKRRLFLDQQEADWAIFERHDHAELRPFTLPRSEAA